MKKYLLRPALSALVLLSFAIVSPANAVLIDFNTAGDFSTNFSNAGPSTSGVEQVASGGVNDSGALNVKQGTNQATTVLYNGASFNGGTADLSITQGVYFKWITNSSLSNQPLMFALTGDLSNQLTIATPPAFVAAGITATGTADNVQLYLRSWNGSANTTSAFSGGGSLTSGNWYYLTATFTMGSAWSMSLSLYNSDASGVVGSQIGATATATNVSTPLASDSTLYGGMRIVNGGGTGLGVDVLDNYTIVPEPGVSTLCLMGVFVLAIFLRKGADEGQNLFSRR